MDLVQINSMWEKDSKIDNTLLDEASIRIPQLHQKYLTLHSEYTMLLKKKEQQVKLLKHKRSLYYSGRISDEEEEPFNFKLLKNEVPGWVEVDKIVQEAELKREYYQTVLNTLSEILKQVHQMSYNIKNIIEWRRFTYGV